MTAAKFCSAKLSRRTLVRQLTLCGGIAAFLPLGAARAEELPRLELNDPAAKLLGYVLSAAEVDLKKYPTYVKGSSCENCSRLEGASGAAYRPCTLFPGKTVAAAGWCNGWAEEI